MNLFNFVRYTTFTWQKPFLQFIFVVKGPSRISLLKKSFSLSEIFYEYVCYYISDLKYQYQPNIKQINTVVFTEFKVTFN